MQQCIGTVKKSSGSLRIIMFALYFFLFMHTFTLRSRQMLSKFMQNKKNFFSDLIKRSRLLWDRFLLGDCAVKIYENLQKKIDQLASNISEVSNLQIIRINLNS